MFCGCSFGARWPRWTFCRSVPAEDWLDAPHMVECKQKFSYPGGQRATVVHYFKPSQILFKRSGAPSPESTSIITTNAVSVVDFAETAAEVSETAANIDRTKDA